MRQFLHASPETFASLRSRCRDRCVRFTGQELPGSCRPARADIGFEVVDRSGATRLYVQRGIEYRGDTPGFREWIEAGHRDFRNFDALVSWIQGTVRDEFHLAEAAPPHLYAVRREARGAVTDLSALRDGVGGPRRSRQRLDGGILFDKLSHRVRGQESALRSLAEVVARHSARTEPKRPAVLFAVGPSGVGKTQSAETLAEALGDLAPDGDGYRFLRLDMTEYQESHRVSQLLGAPQGYVGHEEGSQLLDTLEESPRTIVLFDEIEKAHPSILRVLMNAMDAGRLSRPSKGESGHQVDCRQAVFLFTSNLDAKAILDELDRRNGFGDRTVEDEVCRRRLHAAGIAPEIVGRIGRFLVYRHLDELIRAEILALSVIEVAAEYGLKVDYVEPDAVLALLGQAPNRAFGARPDQFFVDEVLGELFAETAANGVAPSWKVAGPPFRCLPFALESRAGAASGLN